VIAKERREILNPFSDLDRFRREAFVRIPGVVNENEHPLRTGEEQDYYIDFDPLINDPVECRAVVRWYTKTIRSILADHKIDVLGFIEKDRDSGGTTGAIRLAGALSMETGIPNLAIRLGKELPGERIKLRPRLRQTSSPPSLEGCIFVLLSDHSTTGSEGLRAVKAVEYFGGKVSDFVVYSLVGSKFRFCQFRSRGIRVHNFLTVPDDLAGVDWVIPQKQQESFMIPGSSR